MSNRIKNLIQVACDAHNITVEDFYSDLRRTEMVRARQKVMYILYRKFTNPKLKLSDIAKILKKKDHTTIMHGIQRITDDMKKLKSAEALYVKFLQ